MKRKWFVILSVILFVFLAGFVLAHVSGIRGEIDENAEKVEKFVEDIEQGNYLFGEWEKIIRESDLFVFLDSSYEKISPFANPVFIILLAQTPSFTWVFYLSLFLWIVLLVYFFWLIAIFDFFSKKMAFVISLIVLTIFAYAGFFLKASNYIIETVAFFSSPGMRLFAIFAFIVAVFVFFVLGDWVRKKIRKDFIRIKKNQERINRKNLSEFAGDFRRIMENNGKSRK